MPRIQGSNRQSLNDRSLLPEQLWIQVFRLQTKTDRDLCFAPKSKDIHKGLKIGNWTNQQRTAYSNNKLSDEKINLLESVTGWSWNTRANAWEIKFRLLVKYVKEYKTACIPYGAIYENVQLGNWVQTQRGRYKKNKEKRPLSAEQIEKLESLPGWTWDVVADQIERSEK